MKRNVILMFLISVVVASLSGCILSTTPPEGTTVTLKPDALQTFSVKGFLNGPYVWYKGVDVIVGATGASYVYTALEADGTFVLKVQTIDLLTKKPLVKQWNVIVTQNLPPTANAGVDQEIALPGTATLDGSLSSDPEEQPLTYHWTLETRPQTSGAVLDDYTVSPTFTPDVPGAYLIRLIVSDGEKTASDTVTINAYIVNRPPTANAGANSEIYWGAMADLDGRASFDPDGDPLTYKWRVINVPEGSTSALITEPTSATTTFTPDVPGLYRLGLIVNDTHFDSAEATVEITVTNRAPIANAGPDDTVDLVAHESYTLNGAGSVDPDGNPLTYAWEIVSAPTGSSATLDSSTIVNPTFTPDLKGAYVFKLVVSDGYLSSEDEVIISTSKHIPVANANSDIEISFGNTAVLTGALSYDPDGDPLTYAWTVTGRPDGSTVGLVNPTSMTPTFKPDVKGEYEITLIVNDGEIDSAPDTMTITTKNDAPIAEAGNDISALLGTVDDLDGSASSDPNGDTLTYQWEILSHPLGSSAEIVDPTSMTPTFKPDMTGDYVIQLTVNDGEATSTDTININAWNNAPSANAGDDQTILFPAMAQLDGSLSFDPDGTSLSFAWTIESAPLGSTAALFNPDTATPTLTPDVKGEYSLKLVVSDGDLTGEDTVVITFSNTPPTANAGIDQSIADPGETANLDGSASSDPDGTSLSYAWAIDSAPAGSTAALSSSTIVNPTLTPDKEGQYIISLVVSDGYYFSDPDTLTISCGSAPIANAGPDQTILFGYGLTATLDGSASSDPSHSALSYAWTITSKPGGSTAVLVNSTNVNPTLTPDMQGQYVISLVVSDGYYFSPPDEVVITSTNTPPTANAGADQAVVFGWSLGPYAASLNGSLSSDPDGTALTYVWSVTSRPSGSTATITNPTSVTPTFTPDKFGSYTLSLVVYDGYYFSAPDTVVVTAYLFEGWEGGLGTWTIVKTHGTIWPGIQLPDLQAAITTDHVRSGSYAFHIHADNIAATVNSVTVTHTGPAAYVSTISYWMYWDAGASGNGSIDADLIVNGTVYHDSPNNWPGFTKGSWFHITRTFNTTVTSIAFKATNFIGAAINNEQMNWDDIQINP